MAYKLSNRREQDKRSAKNNDPNKVDLGKLATVFIVVGLISLLTSWVYNTETEKVVNTVFRPDTSTTGTEFGPINVRKYNEVYHVSIKANMSVQTWSFIEGQVLNSKKEYLFAFGKELWHEQGRDSDGAWEEANNDYAMNITFPKPGVYYVRFKAESNRALRNVAVKIYKKLGSSLPHLWFGIILILIGIILNEKQNRTIGGMMRKYEN